MFSGARPKNLVMVGTMVISDPDQMGTTTPVGGGVFNRDTNLGEG
jgi:hypothetical protein